MFGTGASIFSFQAQQLSLTLSASSFAFCKCLSYLLLALKLIQSTLGLEICYRFFKADRLFEIFTFNFLFL